MIITKPRVIGAATLAVGVVAATPAMAVDECGPLSGTPLTVTCTTAGNPYPNGILYSVGDGPIFINVDPGVVIDTTVVGNVLGLAGQTLGTGDVTISAPDVSIDVTDIANPLSYGIDASSVGSSLVTAGGSVIVEGGTAYAIHVISTGELASLVYEGTVDANGFLASGMFVGNLGAGDAAVDVSGDITATAFGTSFTTGIFAWTLGGGDALVHYRSGNIVAEGPSPYGIAATVYGAGGGSAEIIVDAGTTIHVSGTSDDATSPNGVSAATWTGTAANGDFVRVDAAATIVAEGPLAEPPPFFGANGIDAESSFDAPITVNFSGPSITTLGSGGIGILALSGSGAIDIVSSGDITTDGIGAHGIFADSGVAGVATTVVFEGEPPGPDRGPRAAPLGVGGAVNVASTGAIATNNIEAFGIIANSATGAVTVDTADISALGLFSSGVLAAGGNAALVHVGEGAVVTGGSQPDPLGVGERRLLPAAGIVIGAREGASQIVNDGTVGALSDLAITELDIYGQQFAPAPLVVDNNGTVVGFYRLGAGDSTFNNNSPNSLDLRNFVDTDADSIRDTKRVAIADSGAGFDVYNNNAAGVVRLLTVLGATTTETTGQILPGGFTAHDTAQVGVEQGQMINLERFENRGLITLADRETGGAGPIAGDVLVITGAPVVDGITGGGGVFLSDGGVLHLDTVLNEGDLASTSDILVLDTTEAGAGGATRIGITNDGGLGALTLGDGIKVVDVLDPTLSAEDAFALDGRAAAGPYEYFLFQGGVADPVDGDWYLRSEGVLRPEIPALLGNTRGALGMVVHTMHERIGEPQFANAARPSNPGDGLNTAWLRVVGGWSSLEAGGFDADTHSWLVQGGVEMAEWALADSNADRLHLGGMFAYGNTDTNASAFLNPNRADGDVDGYVLGGYATWYQNDATHDGIYVDGWLQGGYFDSAVGADFMPTLGYDAWILAASVEAGYAWRVAAEGLVLEPQGQLVLTQYWQDDIIDATDTLISDADETFFTSRVGLRAHDAFVHESATYQPYLELNWWHDFERESIAFNTIGFSGAPADRFEAGGGLNVDIGGGVTLWANAEYQWGNDFEGVEGLVGAKFVW